MYVCNYQRKKKRNLYSQQRQCGDGGGGGSGLYVHQSFTTALRTDSQIILKKQMKSSRKEDWRSHDGVMMKKGIGKRNQQYSTISAYLITLEMHMGSGVGDTKGSSGSLAPDGLCAR